MVAITFIICITIVILAIIIAYTDYKLSYNTTIMDTTEEIEKLRQELENNNRIIGILADNIHDLAKKYE